MTGRTIASSVTARLGTAGRIAVQNDARDTHVVIDTNGWYG